MKEIDMEYKEGFLVHKVWFNKSDFSEYDWDKWDDGFLAFSNVKKRLKDINRNEIPRLLSGKETKNGYLMEMDLWRKGDGKYRELVLERDGKSFFIQDFIFYPVNKNVPDEEKSDGYPCYYEENVSTTPFNSIEIIVPETRIHIFLTTGGTNR